MKYLLLLLIPFCINAQGQATHGSSNFFDGIDDVDSVLDNNSLDFTAGMDFTILVWIKINSTAATEWRIVTKRSGSVGYELYCGSPNMAKLFIGDAGGYSTPTSGRVINDNKWHLVGIQRKADTTVITVDGFLAKVQTTRTGDLSTAVNFSIGRSGSAANFFSGYMTRLSVFTRALLQSEITWNYNHPGQLFSTTGLVLYLPMNEYAGTVLYDSSGLGLNGGMSGSTWNIDTPVSSGKER
jgi:hypothetical protein